jgi:D-3-phosphoglycerate dehydrogenase
LQVRKVDLDTLLRAADFISIHMPRNEATNNMINAAAIAKMKKGVRIINCARGGLVDEAALAEALRSGRLRGAALDAFRQEPPAADNPLLKLENVICTPHTGAHADSATNAMGWGALRDCLAVLRGEAPASPVR